MFSVSSATKYSIKSHCEEYFFLYFFMVLLCDTNHDLKSDYSEIRVIGAGADAVDFALVNLVMRWQND